MSLLLLSVEYNCDSQTVRQSDSQIVSFCLFLYTIPIMSPLGIKRSVAVLLVLSPWIFIPGVIKDVVFIVAGILLFVSTLDLRKKVIHSEQHQETESKPVTHHVVNA